jgi:hypothetical protein
MIRRGVEYSVTNHLNRQAGPAGRGTAAPGETAHRLTDTSSVTKSRLIERSSQQRGQEITSTDDVAEPVPRELVVGIVVAKLVPGFVTQNASAISNQDFADFVPLAVS